MTKISLHLISRHEQKHTSKMSVAKYTSCFARMRSLLERTNSSFELFTYAKVSFDTKLVASQRFKLHMDKNPHTVG